jgi:hypothetical protein
VDQALKACRELADQGQGEAALEQAARLKGLLERAMENDSELHATRRALADIETELAEVSRITEYYSLKPRWWTGRDHPMMIPNPALLELSQRYWEVGRGYRDAYTRYLKGQKEDLWGTLHRVRLDCLQMREDVLAFLREKLEPAEEPISGGLTP